MVKSKEERLLGLEQNLSTIKEYLKRMADSFNKHVDKNNDDFEKISDVLNYGGKK